MIPAARLMGFNPDDVTDETTAEIAIESATALIESYCRGNHVDKAGNPRAGIETVVLTVAARLAANPGQVSKRDSAGQFTRQRGAGFNGFTLAEQAVLNRYRKRATG